MPPILPNYSWDSSQARFRSSATGKFVARRTILDLMERQITGSENRLADLTTALHEGRISPAIWQEQMRTELRRLHTTQAALGAGGFDRMSFREWGRTGGLLRNDYQRLTNLANDIVAGKASLPQALSRVAGYVGNARVNFFEAERDAMRATGKQFEERRRLGASEHCIDCVEYYRQGWQPLGVLPVPGQGSVCGTRCRCAMERREVGAT
jgi:hypothetical protein